MSAKSNEVSEQAVQTDCREGDGGRAEGAEQPGVETAGGGLVVDQFVQRRDPCERLIRIQLANHRTKRGRDRSRFSSGANEDGHRPRVLRVRLIGLGAHRVIDAGPSRVRHNPHDRPPPSIVVRFSEFETLAKRILIRPVRFRCGFVDDGDGLCVSAVAIRKKASAEQGNLKDPEEVRRDAVECQWLLNRLRCDPRSRTRKSLTDPRPHSPRQHQ